VIALFEVSKIMYIIYKTLFSQNRKQFGSFCLHDETRCNNSEFRRKLINVLYRQLNQRPVTARLS
jgi:hypothetical protein